MLLINLFNIQNNFLQTIKYHNILGHKDKNMKISEQKVKRAFLFSDFYVNICTRDNLKDIFDITEERVELGFLTTLVPSDNVFLESIREGPKMIILCDEFEIIELQTVKDFRIGRNAYHSRYPFLIKEHKWMAIVQAILGCPNNTIIKIILKIDANTQIPVLTINYKDEKNIEIYRPLILGHNYKYSKRFIDDDFYYECYMDMLFFLFPKIDLLKYSEIELKQMTPKDDDTSTIKFVGYHVPLLLYKPNYIPKFCFFNEFNIKLVAIKNETTNTNITKPVSQKKGQSIGIECIRPKNSRQEKLSIQIDSYIQDTDNIENIFTVPIHDTVYVNFVFPPLNVLNFEKVPVETFIEIKKLENNDYSFSLGFLIDEAKVSISIDQDLKDSLDNIKLITYDMKEGEELNITYFAMGVLNEKYIINFIILSSETNKANKMIYDLLENKRGSFSIQLCSSQDIIMEYKINLIDTGMIVLSSNRLKEHVETLTKKATVSVNATQFSYMRDDQRRSKTESPIDPKMDDNNTNLNNVAHKFTSSIIGNEKISNRPSVYEQNDTNIMNDSAYNDTVTKPKVNTSLKEDDKSMNTVKHNDTVTKPKVNSSLEECDKAMNDSAYNDAVTKRKVNSSSKESDKPMNTVKHNNTKLRPELDSSQKETNKKKNFTTPIEKTNNSSNGKFKFIMLIILAFIIVVIFVYLIFFR